MQPGTVLCKDKILFLIVFSKFLQFLVKKSHSPGGGGGSFLLCVVHVLSNETYV